MSQKNSEKDHRKGIAKISEAAKVSKPGASQANPELLPAGLYLVATPIGNLGDITLRAIDCLRRANIIYCEDTRVTGRLLTAHGIRNRMAPYHEHNAAQQRPKIIERIKCGEAVALVSDAGTPLISDPGFKLVRAAGEASLPVVPLPGPSALLAALAAGGLPTDRFLFLGFPPNRTAARQSFFQEVKDIEATLVLYETGARLAASLADMAVTLGPRDACLAREVTKLHETFQRASLGDLADHYAASPAPKGEMVVVIGPPEEQQPDEDAWEAELERRLGQESLRDAVHAVALASGLPRKTLYSRALELQRRKKSRKP